MAKSDFFGYMKDAEFSLGREKKPTEIMGCEERTKGFFGYAKKVVIFLGR